MGVQGQVYVGALAATYVALSPLGATPCSACRSASSPPWRRARSTASSPAIAKAKLGANEIVSSLMLNYIAIEIANYPGAHATRPRHRAC